MRIWHTKLIKALPKIHLVAQWRELSAIAGAIQKNGTPNHVLVNFVLDYDYDNFISYAYFKFGLSLLHSATGGSAPIPITWSRKPARCS